MGLTATGSSSQDCCHYLCSHRAGWVSSICSGGRSFHHISELVKAWQETGEMIKRAERKSTSRPHSLLFDFTLTRTQNLLHVEGTTASS